jgi:hypothetical protein
LLFPNNIFQGSILKEELHFLIVFSRKYVQGSVRLPDKAFSRKYIFRNNLVFEYTLLSIRNCHTSSGSFSRNEFSGKDFKVSNSPPLLGYFHYLIF